MEPETCLLSSAVPRLNEFSRLILRLYPKISPHSNNRSQIRTFTKQQHQETTHHQSLLLALQAIMQTAMEMSFRRANPGLDVRNAGLRRDRRAAEADLRKREKKAKTQEAKSASQRKGKQAHGWGRWTKKSAAWVWNVVTGVFEFTSNVVKARWR